MAHLLKALGEAALRPQKVRGVWHKPAISGRVAGELRRAALLEGREWPYDLERPKPKKHGLVKKLKGHKHEAESRIRQADIDRRMNEMPKKIADYRKASKPKEPTLLESLTTTAKERKLKARALYAVFDVHKQLFESAALAGSASPATVTRLAVVSLNSRCCRQLLGLKTQEGMQSRLPAFCNPVATHASTWDPTTAGLSVPLNIKLDGRIVPSPASPDGARVDFSHVVVLDGLFGEQERSGLWDILIGTPALSVTAFPAQQLAQAELADPSPSCTDSEQQQQQQQLRIPVQHDSIRNSARTIDDQLLLQPDLAQDMGTAGQPRSHLGGSPAFGSPQMPFTGRDDLRTLSNANIPSADRAHEPDNLMMPGPMMNGVRPLDTADPMDVTVGRLIDGVSQIPPLDRWERRTADRAGLPGTWGLKPHMLDLLARGQIPAAVEVQTRLASLFPEFIVAHMPTDAIQTSTGTSSSNDTDSMPDAPGDNQTTIPDLPAGDGVCSKVHAPVFNFVLAEGHDTAGQPLGHDAAHQQQQQQQQGPTQEQMSGNLHNPSSPHRPPSSFSCDQSSAEAAVSSPAGHALETLELPSGVAKQALAAHHDPTEPSSPESAQRCESVGAPTCKAEDVAAGGQIPEVEESGHCSAFLGNAAVHGDTFQWHVDADPSDFAFPSPWMDIYGQYCNREPGQPLFVSLLLYLDADWPRDFAAETLFLDGDTDVGFAVRPKPYRAILMDQDVLHRVSAPSMLAGQRPRFSLVWKLLFYPRSSSTICSIARREWGPSACIGSAAKVQQVISSLAGKRKCTD